MELIKKLATKPAKLVESFDQIEEDAEAMLKMLDEGIKKGDGYANGAALHHAQVSEDPFDFFVVSDMYKDLFGGGRIRRIVMNPKITDQKEYVPFEEGCLSFLDRPYLKTKRFNHIDLVCYNRAGAGHLRRASYSFEGFPAFLVQHEVDHGQGKHIHDGRFAEYNPRIEMHKEAK